MPVDIIPYEPHFYVKLPHLLDVGSAWRGVDTILYDIVNRFNVPQEKALEFGVQYGYSISALANVFEEVTGVDTFRGDRHTGYYEDHFLETKGRLSEWPNVCLVRERFQDFIFMGRMWLWDLIHIDIVHDYQETYDCGMWSVEHAPVVLFHDTQEFPRVKEAVADIATDAKRTFYNYEPFHGLGILVKE